MNKVDINRNFPYKWKGFICFDQYYLSILVILKACNNMVVYLFIISIILNYYM